MITSSAALQRIETAPPPPPSTAPLRLAPPPVADGLPSALRLPDPAPIATSLARCVFEILAGAREIEQIARWVTDGVYRHLQKRIVLAARARNARGEPARRPSFRLGTVRVTEPNIGVVEAVVVIHGRARSRAVAIRLEAFGTRWRATAVHVL